VRTIDADLFKNNVKAWAENIRDFRSDNKCFFTEENVLKMIDDQPTLEVEPVKHGKWIYDFWCAFKCSECGAKKDKYKGENLTPYCPMCGAKMK